VVSSKHKSTIKLLFIVLHELGHIYKQHIDNSCWIDAEIKLDSKEPEEIEANQVAKKIIFNDSNVNYYQKIGMEYISGESLVSLARSYSQQEKYISTESIIMNYSWYKAEKNQNRKGTKDIIWRTANKALKIVGANSQTLQIMQQKFQDNLDWDKLSEDNLDYLEIITALQ
jgi:Zn-dependent peptidase ImmA (M78 family)